MDTSGIIFLAVSASISFGLGRLFMHLRAKKRKALEKESQKCAAQALLDQPPEPESKNRAKRKRQLRQARRGEGTDEAGR
jgi:hypothetical protein